MTPHALRPVPRNDCENITISISMETSVPNMHSNTHTFSHILSLAGHHELLASSRRFRIGNLPQTVCPDDCGLLCLERYVRSGSGSETDVDSTGCLLPYQRLIFWLEVSLLAVLLLLQISCIFLSRIEQRLLSSALIVPSIAGALYFTIWQQYVLRIDVIANAILILLQGLHVISSLV